MAKLTVLDIYKLLPKTNCGECKFPTCMAFAMQVAAKKVALEACPYVSDAAKQELADSAAPPMRVVTIGPDRSASRSAGRPSSSATRRSSTVPPPWPSASGPTRPRTSAGSHRARQGSGIRRVGQYVRVELVALEEPTATPSFRAAARLADEKGLAWS